MKIILGNQRVLIHFEYGILNFYTLIPQTLHFCFPYVVELFHLTPKNGVLI